MITDCLLDAVLDSVRLLPFLLVAFLLLEGIEHRSRERMVAMVTKGRHTGPLWGAVLGLVPQCGFSVMGANMYAGGVITLGTLMAIFLSTSDEAVIIMLGNPDRIGTILPLLGCKLVIGVLFGFLIDRIVKTEHKEDHHEPHELCENCGCDKYPGILRPALYHTEKLFLFILIFNFVINLVIGLVGEDSVSALLLSGSFLQPFLTALIGLIPNCAASILITELYLAGSLSFGSTVAGLCAGAGVGLAVLFRMHRCTGKNIGIVGILYGISALCGICINLF